jgi:hypothetical protein
MKKTTNSMFVQRNRGFRRWLSVIGCALLLLTGQVTFAQANAFLFEASVGTYVPITGGTVLFSSVDNSPSLDSKVSGLTTLTAPIVFNGVTYTQFIVSSNGFLSLGSATTSEYTTTILTTSVGSNVILSPFGSDMNQAAVGNSGVRYEQTDEETVWEWYNMRRFNKTEAFSFQVRIDNTSGVVQFIYSGPELGTEYGTVNTTGIHVGIKTGVGIFTGLVIPTNSPWNSPDTTRGATPAPGAYANPQVGPTAGLTYTFTPPLCVPPSGLAIQNISSINARIVWTSPADIPSNDYEYYVSTENTAPDADTAGEAVDGNSYYLNDLDPNTTYYVWMRSNCGEDGASVWTSDISFKTLCDAVTAPLTEGFNATTLPDCWNKQIVAVQTASKITFVTTGATLREGTHYVQYNSGSSTGGASGSMERLITPVLNTVDFRGVDVTFDMYHTTSTAADKLAVEWTIDGGETWTTAQTYDRYRDTAGWDLKVVHLPVEAVSDNLMVAIKFISAYGSNMYIDALSITETPSCVAPSALAVTGTTSDSAVLTWTNSISNPAEGYDYYLSTTNTAPEATTVATGTTTGTVTGLDASTTYYVWLRANCGSDTSLWTTGVTFKTKCITIDAPYAQGFNATTAPDCWSTAIIAPQTASKITFVASSTSTPAMTSAFEGSHMVMYSSFNSTGGGTGSMERLISPTLNTSDLTSVNVEFEFYNSSNGSATLYLTEGVIVEWSIDGGTTWTAAGEYLRYRATSGWDTKKTTLPAAAVHENLLVALKFVNNVGYNMFVDNFKVIQTPSCVEPTALAVAGATSDGVTLTWTNSVSNPAEGYDYYVSTTNTAPEATTVATGTTTGTIGDLTPNTRYYLWLRANCGGTDVSEWTDGVTFKTECLAFDAPYAQGFNATTAPDCWNTAIVAVQTASKISYVTTGASLREGTHYVQYNSAINTGGGSGSIERLISPVINTSDLTSVNVQFDMYHSTSYASYANEGVTVEWSIDNGQTWTEAAPLYVRYRATAGWDEKVITLPAGAITENLMIALKFSSQYGSNIYVDAFKVIETPSCLKPSGTSVDLATVGITTAEVSWVASESNPTGGYEYIVSTSNTTPGIDATATGSVVAGELTATLTDLNPITTYYVWVRSVCDNDTRSEWSNSATFTTLCTVMTAPTAMETFEGYTSSVTTPNCWSEGKGTLDITASNTPLTLTGTTSNWLGGDYNSNAANGRAVYINLHSDDKEWFVSPQIDLGDGTTPFQLEFTASLLPWTITDPAPTTIGEKFVKVLISTDGGATWSNANTLKTYDSTNIPYGGVTEAIALTGYTGIVKFAVYAFSTATTNDTRFYFDNCRVVEVPSCIKPTNLAVGITGKDFAELSWTAAEPAPAEGYEYYVSTTNVAPTTATVATGSVGAGVVTATVTDLDPSTTYYVWVRSNCGTDNVSEWTLTTVSFKTLCDYPEILTPASTSVCGEGSATVSATTRPGANIRWYSAQTGGTMLAEGIEYVTPVIEATTTYWASAYTTEQEATAGFLNPTTSISNSYTNGWGIVFSTTQSVRLKTVDVFAQTVGNVIVAITDANGIELYATLPIAVSNTGTTTPNAIPLNYTIPAGNYRMVIKTTTGNASLYRDNFTTSPFPSIGTDGSLTVTGGYWSPATPSYNFYFYNIKYQAECESVRSAVEVTVTEATPIVATVSTATICEGATTTLSVTSDNADYTYVWTPGDLTGATQNVSPTATTTYTVTATDATTNCVTTETVTVTVNPLPAVAEMDDVIICEGTIATLTYTSPSGDVISGTATTSTSANSTAAALGPNPLQNYYGATKQQWLYTAAELTALGLVSGSQINSFALHLSATNGTPLNNMIIKMKNTSVNAFTGTTANQWITDMTVVKSSFSHTPTVGANTFVLDASFIWDGTSNLAIEMNYNNYTNGSGSTNTALYSPTSFVSTLFYRTDTNITPTDMDTYVGTASFSYSTRNNVMFSFTTPTSTVWTPVTGLYTDASATTPYTGGVAGTVYAKPTAATTYTATITSLAGCSVSDDVTVTVTTTEAPDAIATQTLCNGATLANIVTTATDVKWYAAATGGNALAATTVLVNGTEYFASQTIDGCESASRTAFTAVVTTTAAPEADATQSFCAASTIEDLVADGQAVQWYNAATGGTALDAAAALVNGTAYYASQTLNGCESARTAVMAIVSILEAPTAAATQTFCNAATVADLVANGSNDATINWFTDATITTALDPATALVNGTTYYVGQVNNYCASDRTAVTVVISNVTAPVITNITPSFCGGATLADVITDTPVQWYAAATGGTALATTTTLVDGTVYYASQTIDGCESAARTEVTVSVTTITVPTADATQAFCAAATIADLEVTGTAGATVTWYADSNSATTLETTTSLANGVTYYVTQTVGDCESARTAVTAIISILDAPTAAATQTFCNAATVADLVANGSNEATINWFTDATITTALDPATALVDGTTYYVGQANNYCTSDRTAVTVVISNVTAPTGDATQTFAGENIGDVTIADIVVTGTGTIIWYASLADAQAGINPLDATTALTTDTTYYATQTVGTCTSTDVLAVTVTVTLGKSDFDVTSFSYYPNPVKDVLTISYSSDITSVAVFNLIGQQVIAKSINSTQGTIDMSNLAEGAYIINVTAGNHVKTIKVIKR